MEDTYNLKPKSKIKIAWMPDNRPGRWMYHCNILEHHEAGMMAHFEVVDPLKGSMVQRITMCANNNVNFMRYLRVYCFKQ